MKRFEIFFAGGETVGGSTMLDWVSAPKTGVQAVVVENDDGSQEKIHGFDYYSLINGGDIVGADLSLRQGYVKEGTLISDGEFAEIVSGLESNSDIWNGAS